MEKACTIWHLYSGLDEAGLARCGDAGLELLIAESEGLQEFKATLV